MFKNRESGTGFQNTLLVMNLAYFPEERGPYNFDPSLTPEGNTAKSAKPLGRDYARNPDKRF